MGNCASCGQKYRPRPAVPTPQERAEARANRAQPPTDKTVNVPSGYQITPIKSGDSENNQ